MSSSALLSVKFRLVTPLFQVALRKPVCINDLPTQKVFWDRRVVHTVLDAIGVRTPPRLEVNRDGGPKVDVRVAAQLEKEFGFKINEDRPFIEPKMKGDETLTVGSKSLNKSFVEKPVSGEDHNVYIYFSKKRGGGGRRLFRKVNWRCCSDEALQLPDAMALQIGNKSSDYETDLNDPRDDGSYVYEKFMDGGLSLPVRSVLF